MISLTRFAYSRVIDTPERSTQPQRVPCFMRFGRNDSTPARQTSIDHHLSLRWPAHAYSHQKLSSSWPQIKARCTDLRLIGPLRIDRLRGDKSLRAARYYSLAMGGSQERANKLRSLAIRVQKSRYSYHFFLRLAALRRAPPASFGLTVTWSTG
jgi:hypothetical protein